MPKITINPALCDNCGFCVYVCPWNLYVQNEEKTTLKIVHEEFCVSCGQCVAICPNGAVNHLDFPKGSIRPIKLNNIPSSEHILEMLRARRSIRLFSDMKVAKKTIEKIIDGARFAPSSNNIQSTEFIVVQDEEKLAEITELTIKYLKRTVNLLNNPIIKKLFLKIPTDFTTEIFFRVKEYERVLNVTRNGTDLIRHFAPLLLFFHSRKGISYAEINANLALQNASLMVQSLGLGSFYAGYILVACKKTKHFSKLLNIPPNRRIHGCLAIGYPKVIYKNWIQRKSPIIKWI